MHSYESEFIINNGVLNEYIGKCSKVIVPNGVHTIGMRAFSFNRTVSEIVLPLTLKAIEEQAFYECSGLESIIIPDSVERIANQALATIPKAVITIMSNDEDMDMNESAFWGEDLEVNVKEIHAPYGSKAMRCAMRMNIPYVRMEGNPQKYIYINDVFCCQGNTLVEYLGQASEVRVPDEIEIIGRNAFLGEFCKKPKIIYLPDSVTQINSAAFMMCDTIEEVHGPGVKTIESSAFRYCKNLKIADFPNVITVGYKAFSKCFNLEQTHLVEMQPKNFSILNKNK